MNKHLSPHGRQVYTRGPVVYLLLVLSLIANFAVVGLFIFSVTTNSSRIDHLTLRTDLLNTKQQAIQESRKEAIHDTCVALRDVVLSQSGSQPFPLVLHLNGQTISAVGSVPDAQNRSKQLTKRAGLSDCNKFTQQHTNLPLRGH